MALLIVQAASEDTIAAPGNRNPNYIVVSVTDSNGKAVQGLTNTNFKVDPMVVGPGGSLVEVTSVTGGRIAGFYFVNVVPSKTETWRSGGYIFAVVVEANGNRGQALCSVLLD
jgi:hypothetical protein